MQAQQFEQYCFYRLYSIDFDTVRHSLRMLRRYRRQDVRHSILRDIMVGYARPFSGNKGRLIKEHRLKTKYVPSQLRSLHNEMIDARMRMLAHTDYDFRNPRVARWPSTRGSLYPMAFRRDDMEKFENRVMQIEALVKAVESNVKAKIREIENQVLEHEPTAK
ncbi:MAG: hypothetical protein WCH20_07420 [Nitrospira sp.]